MSQGNADYNSSRGPLQKIEDFYDVGSRLTADACGAGGEVMRGYCFAPLLADLPNPFASSIVERSASDRPTLQC